jgi:hypothetical protein
MNPTRFNFVAKMVGKSSSGGAINEMIAHIWQRVTQCYHIFSNTRDPRLAKNNG